MTSIKSPHAVPDGTGASKQVSPLDECIRSLSRRIANIDDSNNDKETQWEKAGFVSGLNAAIEVISHAQQHVKEQIKKLPAGTLMDKDIVFRDDVLTIIGGAESEDKEKTLRCRSDLEARKTAGGEESGLCKGDVVTSSEGNGTHTAALKSKKVKS